MKKNNEKNNGVFLIVILFIGAFLVFFFPKIHEVLYKASLPEIEKSESNEKYEKKELTDEILSEIHSPIMRTSAYSDFTYYSLETFKVTDMSNQDILYNAFIDMYEGNITDSSYSSACGNINKEFNSKYIDLRIKNILGRNLKYNLEDFFVPADSNSNYVGNWIFNNNIFYYNGLCSTNTSSIKMYDVETMVNAYYDGDDIVITYYVGFVKVEGDNFTIYSDPNMTHEIGTGVGSDYKAVFDSLDDKLKKKYQYTYKNTLCTYDEYCLYEGKWL